jgi:hypothetical protein
MWRYRKSNQVRVRLPKPLVNIGSEFLGNPAHLIGFEIGNHIRPLIIRDVPLLPKSIEFIDGHGIHTNGQRQRLDHPMVVACPLSLVSGGGQGR